MKLVILLYSLGAGGAERITSLLLENLAKEYTITLVLLEDIQHYPLNVQKIILGRNRTTESGIKKLLKLPLLAFKYRKIIRDCEISLSLMTRPNYINILAGMLCKLTRKSPKILICERSYPSKQYGYSNLSSTINRKLITLLYNKADKISANSPQNLADLVENFGIAQKKITLLLNFFDLNKINAQSREDSTLKEQILSSKVRGRFAFVSIGRLDSGKNHRLLVDCMQYFKDKADLFIFGEGEKRNELEAQILSLGLESCVHLLGRTPNPYAPLSVADCFVFASNHEGFPNVLVESLALGIPLLTTDCAPKEILEPLGEFIDNQKHCEICKGGILVPLNDKEAFSEAMRFIYAQPHFFSPSNLQSQARKFAIESQLPHYKQWIFE
ncbi:glycosyltransferase [Helicobacter ganmani]|uniref:Glycosyltransferase n=1 Tax=Helicobacter ganmani TaxID=60246 RepID=A0A3D8IBR0_9HELI|nr:glycosyltransferase [Helicobacter ganmani]RDU62560.1 glycosyltransferase [Helicobacter ganmani]